MRLALALPVVAAGLGLATLARAAQESPELDPYDRRDTPVVEVVRSTRPSVVFIQSNVPTTRRDFFWRVYDVEATTSGSGVVIDEDGYIITNYHVVKGSNRITVQFDPADDSTRYAAKLISYEEPEDLALLKIDGDSAFPTVPMGTSDDLLLGETVIAIGNPYGQTHTVSTGIVSGLHRNLETQGLKFQNLIQTDASINPGNSGGPLLNVNGELIGINTVMNTVAENIGFAIPVDRVRFVLREHLLSLDQARAWLGFDVELPSFRVTNVVEGGPAASAGLEMGDVLLSLGGRDLASADDYKLARLTAQPSERVPVSVRRDGRSKDVELAAWNWSDGLLYERLGATVEPISLGPSPYDRRLRVQRVAPTGAAAGLGIRRGDILEAFQPAGRTATRLRTPEELVWLVARLDKGTDMRMRIWRDEDGDGRLEYDGEYSELFEGNLELR